MHTDEEGGECRPSARSLSRTRCPTAPRSLSPTCTIMKEMNWDRFWGFWGRPVMMAYIKCCFRYRFRGYRRLIDEAMRERPIRSALEIGAGTGILSKTLQRRCDFDFTLLDSNEKAYRLYRRHSNVGRYLREDLFAHQSHHDLVFSDGVIEHFERGRRIESIRRHRLCSDSHVIIFVPKRSFLTQHLLRFSQTGDEFEHKFRPAELLQDVESAGLLPRRTVEDLHMIGVWAR